MGKDFDLNKYLGIWYEMHRSLTANNFEKGDCVVADYKKSTDGFIRVKNSEQRYTSDKKLKQSRFSVKGWAKKRDPKSTLGRLQVKFSIFQPVWGAYDILHTDYKSYALVYSCTGGFWGKF